MERGDPILCEEYSYFYMLDSVITAAGYKVLPVAMDEHGMKPEHLNQVRWWDAPVVLAAMVQCIAGCLPQHFGPGYSLVVKMILCSRILSGAIYEFWGTARPMSDIALVIRLEFGPLNLLELPDMCQTFA